MTQIYSFGRLPHRHYFWDGLHALRFRHIGLALVFTIGIAARCYHLGQIPRGIFFDEAADGNDAAQAAAAHTYKIFYAADAGREGLWINLISLPVARFGHTAFALRFWSPLMGSLTILLLYLLAARWFGNRIALIAAWFFATSFWHLVFSRIAFRGILVPFFLTGAIYFLQLAFDRAGFRMILWTAVAGAFYGLGFYSYIPYRITPLLFVLIFYLAYRTGTVPKRRLATAFTIWTLSALLTALPLGLFFLRNPAMFSNRMSNVSIFNARSPAVTLLLNIIREVGMFFFKGDANWRHNLRHSPELILPVALFFLSGLILAFRRAGCSSQQQNRYTILLTWLFLMLVPAILSNDAIPHSLRSIGSLPAAILLAAIAADWILLRYQHRRAITAAILFVIMASGFADLYRYFDIWSKKPQVAAAYFAPTEDFPKLCDLFLQPQKSSLPSKPRRLNGSPPDFCTTIPMAVLSCSPNRHRYPSISHTTVLIPNTT